MRSACLRMFAPLPTAEWAAIVICASQSRLEKNTVFVRECSIIKPAKRSTEGALRTHEITVSYTTDNDGIHLHCSCGWDEGLGHNPTVDQLTEAADRHHRDSAERSDAGSGN